MPSLILYLVKFSISLSLVYLFYHFVLRRLTFYNWNRWFLLMYSVLCFFIPFIDLSASMPVVAGGEMTDWVPLITPQTESGLTPGTAGFSFFNALQVLFLLGFIIMVARIGIQLHSFHRLVKRAKLLSTEIVNIYQVDEDIIPFSFGRSVFVNPSLHTTAELKEIILHEFIHVKQRHSIDIFIAEILCMFNWFNPFAWLMRSAIRQNLEFVADEQVLRNGVDKQEYQYLLLRVIGNNQYSITQKFNFTSLKKRIIMMNKNKSASRQLFRFLFILPLLSIVLLSFRKEIGLAIDSGIDSPGQPAPLKDTIPAVPVNAKGYYIDIIDKKGVCEVLIKDSDRKEVKRMLLTEWNANKDENRMIYGDILPPPPPVPPATLSETLAPLPPLPPVNTKLPPSPPAIVEPAWAAGYSEYEITEKTAVFKTKDGKIEKYNLERPADKKAFEKKFGDLNQYLLPSVIDAPGSPVPPVQVRPPAIPTAPMVPSVKSVSGIADPVMEGGEQYFATITSSATEGELDKIKSDMKSRGVNLTYEDILYSNGYLVKLAGRIEGGKGISRFSATNFKSVKIGLNMDDGQVWTKVL